MARLVGNSQIVEVRKASQVLQSSALGVFIVQNHAHNGVIPGANSWIGGFRVVSWIQNIQLNDHLVSIEEESIVPRKDFLDL